MYLGLDPSIRSTGWALLDHNRELLDYGRIKTVLENKSSCIIGAGRKFAEIAERVRPVHAFIEHPVNQGIVGRTTGTQSWLFGISYYLGGICAARLIPFEFILVSTWKGTLPKDVVWRRLERIYGSGLPRTTGKNFWEHDAVDAIGICRYGIDRYCTEDGLAPKSRPTAF